MKLIAYLLVVMKIWPLALGSGVPCDIILVSSFGWQGLEMPTTKDCIMKSPTIDAEGFTITTPADETVDFFNAFLNKKMQFLPENFAEKFPNLVVMWAPQCSIRKISKKNFQNLHKLRGIGLGDNRIEKIASDTFEGLVSLTHLFLYVNQIKFLNGEAFASLHNLREVTFNGNVCIQDNFSKALGDLNINLLRQTVTAKCGFVESDSDDLPASNVTSNSQQSDKCERLQVEFKNQTEKNSKLDAELLLMKTNLESKSADILRLEQQATQIIKTFVDKLELKIQEISALSKEVLENAREIVAKNEQILNLEKKIKSFEGSDQSWWSFEISF